MSQPRGNAAGPVDGSSISEETLPRIRRLLSGSGYEVRPLPVYLGFLAFVVARYIQLGARRDILATVRFEFLLGAAVAAMCAFVLMRRPSDLGASRPIIVAIIALFAAMLLQLPMAASPVLAEIVFKDRVIKFAMLTFFMAVMIESPKYLAWFLAAFMFSVFYITLEAVEGLISGGLVWQNQGVMRLHGAVPIYAHPNSLGGVAMGSLPFVVFLFWRTRNWFYRLGMLATAGTSLICVVYSGSRTAYVGLIGFVLWWWLQSPHKWRFLMIGLVVGVVAVPALPEQYLERFKSIGGQEAEGQSKEARIVILNDAVAVLADQPWGVGIASFPAVRMQRFGRIQDTHNLYLEVATNLGVQGLVVFLFLVGTMMWMYRRSMMVFRAQRDRLRILMRDGRLPASVRARVKAHDKDLELLIASAQAAGGFILIRLVLGVFGMDLYEVYWWFGAGLAMALSGLEVTTRRVTARQFEAARLLAATPEKDGLAVGR